MNSLKFRWDSIPELPYDKVLEYVLENTTKHVIFEETSPTTSKLHYHSLLETDHNVRQFKRGLTKEFGKLGTATAVAALADARHLNNYKHYIAKDGNCKTAKGFSKLTISTWTRLSDKNTNKATVAEKYLQYMNEIARERSVHPSQSVKLSDDEILDLTLDFFTVRKPTPFDVKKLCMFINLYKSDASHFKRGPEREYLKAQVFENLYKF